MCVVVNLSRHWLIGSSWIFWHVICGCVFHVLRKGYFQEVVIFFVFGISMAVFAYI